MSWLALMLAVDGDGSAADPLLDVLEGTGPLPHDAAGDLAEALVVRGRAPAAEAVLQGLPPLARACARIQCARHPLLRAARAHPDDPERLSRAVEAALACPVNELSSLLADLPQAAVPAHSLVASALRVLARVLRACASVAPAFEAALRRLAPDQAPPSPLVDRLARSLPPHPAPQQPSLSREQRSDPFTLAVCALLPPVPDVPDGAFPDDPSLVPAVRAYVAP